MFEARMFSRIAVYLMGAAVAMSGCGIVGPSTESLLRGQTFDRIGRAIGGITVEVLDGLGAGTIRRTDAQGHFELSSSDFVSGAGVTLRFGGNGVLTRTATAQWQSVSSLKGYYPRFWLDTMRPRQDSIGVPLRPRDDGVHETLTAQRFG